MKVFGSTFGVSIATNSIPVNVDVITTPPLNLNSAIITEDDNFYLITEDDSYYLQYEENIR